MIKTLVKGLFPNNIKRSIIKYNAKRKYKSLEKLVCTMRKTSRILYLLATPNHGNVGDQAIAKAEVEFLRNELSQFFAVEIMFNEYLEWKEYLPSLISPDEVIMYHGGGNMGTEYFECESVFRDIIKRFPWNTIISFPQTIYYDNSQKSQQEFEKSKQIYASNPKLILTAREQKSYEIMKAAYGHTNRVLLVPDIVLYMQRREGEEREGVLTCLRNDVERNLEQVQHEEIDYILQKFFTQITKSDTVVPLDYVSEQMRDDIVDNKLKEFQGSELVVTDRLHGMVFAYLTNTPCVVFNNYNHKVSGLHRWIQSSNLIVLIGDVNELEEAINRVKGKQDDTSLQFSEYDKFREIIQECGENA